MSQLRPRRLELRIGINLGDVVVEPEDIFGDGVNIAARLQALAQPGTVCISQTVYDQVKNKLDLDYRPSVAVLPFQNLSGAIVGCGNVRRSPGGTSRAAVALSGASPKVDVVPRVYC